MESIDPAVQELNKLCRIARLYEGTDEMYLKEIYEKLLDLLDDAPYLKRSFAWDGFIKQEGLHLADLRRRGLI